MCFYLKISRVDVFCLNFNWIHMFCNDDHSKSVPESTQPRGFTSWKIVDSLHEKVKNEDLIIELKVIISTFNDNISKFIKCLPANGFAIMYQHFNYVSTFVILFC